MARRWLTQRSQLPADVLSGVLFKPRNNSLSVYKVEPDRKNAARVLAAIGSKASMIDHVDCIFFDETIVRTIGIKIERTAGATPDRVANEWHLDLTDLSATQLKILAEELINRAEMVSFFQDEILVALRDADAAGDLDKSLINDKIKKSAGI